MLRIFRYTISTRVFFASHTYECTSYLLFSLVATSLSSIIASFVLRSFSSILLKASDILSICDMTSHLELQIVNTTINISFRDSVSYLSNATNVTNSIAIFLHLRLIKELVLSSCEQRRSRTTTKIRKCFLSTL